MDALRVVWDLVQRELDEGRKAKDEVLKLKAQLDAKEKEKQEEMKKLKEQLEAEKQKKAHDRIILTIAFFFLMAASIFLFKMESILGEVFTSAVVCFFVLALMVWNAWKSILWVAEKLAIKNSLNGNPGMTQQ